MRVTNDVAETGALAVSGDVRIADLLAAVQDVGEKQGLTCALPCATLFEDFPNIAGAKARQGPRPMAKKSFDLFPSQDGQNFATFAEVPAQLCGRVGEDYGNHEYLGITDPAM